MSIAPNADNYTLGRGRLLFNRKNSDGSYQGMRDLGNANNFVLSISVDKLDHYSNRSGIRVKDKSVTLGVNINGSFNLDEINAENLAMTFLASITEIVQTAEVGQSYTIEASKKGQYFETGDVFLDAGTVVVTSDGGGTTYTLGTDYTVLDKSGQIFIMANSSIADDTQLEVTYNTLAKTYKKLNAYDDTAVEGILYFISDSSVGSNMQMRMWAVTLMPSGDAGMISEEWNSLDFEVEIGSDEANHPLFPYMECIVE